MTHYFKFYYEFKETVYCVRIKQKYSNDAKLGNKSNCKSNFASSERQ